MILIAIERPSNEVIINPKLALNKTLNQLTPNGNKCVKNGAPVTYFFFFFFSSLFFSHITSASLLTIEFS
jgi:hypothetical protein